MGCASIGHERAGLLEQCLCFFKLAGGEFLGDCLCEKVVFYPHSAVIGQPVSGHGIADLVCILGGHGFGLPDIGVIVRFETGQCLIRGGTDIGRVRSNFARELGRGPPDCLHFRLRQRRVTQSCFAVEQGPGLLTHPVADEHTAGEP